MAGFDYRGPVPSLTPEQLAQLGLAAFKPPAPMSMGGMSMAPPGETPGFNVTEGAKSLGAGLGALLAMKGGGAFDGTRTGGDADLGGYNKTAPGGMVDVGGGVMLPNPNGNTYDSSGSLIGPMTQPGFWGRLFGR